MADNFLNVDEAFLVEKETSMVYKEPRENARFSDHPISESGIFYRGGKHYGAKAEKRFLSKGGTNRTEHHKKPNWQRNYETSIQDS